MTLPINNPSITEHEFLHVECKQLVVNKPTYEPKDSEVVLSKQQEEQSKQKGLDGPD